MSEEIKSQHAIHDENASPYVMDDENTNPFIEFCERELPPLKHPQDYYTTSYDPYMEDFETWRAALFNDKSDGDATRLLWDNDQIEMLTLPHTETSGIKIISPELNQIEQISKTNPEVKSKKKSRKSKGAKRAIKKISIDIKGVTEAKLKEGIVKRKTKINDKSKKLSYDLSCHENLNIKKLIKELNNEKKCQKRRKAAK